MLVELSQELGRVEQQVVGIKEKHGVERVGIEVRVTFLGQSCGKLQIFCAWGPLFFLRGPLLQHDIDSTAGRGLEDGGHQLAALPQRDKGHTLAVHFTRRYQLGQQTGWYRWQCIRVLIRVGQIGRTLQDQHERALGMPQCVETIDKLIAILSRLAHDRCLGDPDVLFRTLLARYPIHQCAQSLVHDHQVAARSQ